MKTDVALPTAELVRVLQSSLYPGASDASVQMVLSYCAAAGLDPMLKPVHIVPMWDSKTRDTRDVIMPGIGLYRTQASRTAQMGGVSEPEFGPDVTEEIGGQQITYPAWCRVTVKRVLPDGFVAEFTAREFWRENFAVRGGKERSVAPNAMWTRRPYGQLAKCFDSETEVLTTNGFEPFAAITGRVIQVSEHGLDPCDARPFQQHYDGEMIVADGTRLNFSVTPNHDMLTTAGKIEAGALYEKATKVGDKFLIPRAPAANKPDRPIPDTVLRLIGYFLADGSHTGYRQARIAVSRKWKIEALREIALHQSEGVKRDAGRVAHAGRREITTTADKAQFVYDFAMIEPIASADKQINSEAALSLSQRQARVIVDALTEFDGSDNGAGVRRLTQSNVNVIRGFELLAVHAGYSVSARIERHSDIGSSFSITISDAAHFPVVRGVEKNSASLVKRKNVSGRVWCVTVPSGVIVVRRKGFSMLCGNCAEAQALRKAFPELGSAPTADEMEGKEINMGAADVVSTERNDAPPAPPVAPVAPEKEAYPADRFEQNLPKWVSSGRTAEEMIAMIETRASLSEAQKEAMRKAFAIDTEKAA